MKIGSKYIEYHVDFMPNPGNGKGIRMKSFVDYDTAVRFYNSRKILYPAFFYRIRKVELTTVAVMLVEG